MGPATYTDANASDRHIAGDTDPYRNAIGNPYRYNYPDIPIVCVRLSRMTSPESRPPTDYRRYRRETERKLIIAVILFLLLVGSGLIALIYRPAAGVQAFICLLAGVCIIAMLWILLTLIERWVGE